MTRLSSLTLAGWVLLAMSGCPDEPGGRQQDAGIRDAGVPQVVALAASAKNELLWRRYRALEQGLANGLVIDESRLCNELGRFSCVEQVHLVALGGNDAFEQGLHEPVPEPTGSTAVAVERLVWSACVEAVNADAARAVRRVFLDLDLSEAAGPLDLSDQAQAWAVEDTIRNLYRQLHAREPIDAERQELMRLSTDDDGHPLHPRDFALLSCFAIASTTETVFF